MTNKKQIHKQDKILKAITRLENKFDGFISGLAEPGKDEPNFGDRKFQIGYTKDEKPVYVDKEGLLVSQDGVLLNSGTPIFFNKQKKTLTEETMKEGIRNSAVTVREQYIKLTENITIINSEAEGEDGSFVGDKITITNDNFQSIKDFLENKYKEGSQGWAMKKALQGEKIEGHGVYQFEWGCLNEEGDFVDQDGTKRGLYPKVWKIWEKKPETMTLREAIEQNKKFKLFDEICQENYGMIVGLKNKGNGEILFNDGPGIKEIINNLDTQVEIIQE
jgi:hypothetical protein